ncbi:L-aspartate oxidase, partial [Caulobacter sp. 17J65-9]|nr:L-aspartate oxidase [Caulobacter sp. 17J65-9]
AELRAAMSREAGVERNGAGLSRLLATIQRLEDAHGRAAPLVAARLIAHAALLRQESRGGHYRSDFPNPAAEARRAVFRLADLSASAEPMAAE